MARPFLQSGRLGRNIRPVPRHALNPARELAMEGYRLPITSLWARALS